MITTNPTGSAKFFEGKLTITTMAKRGKKTVPHVVVYTVTDLCPDHAVANPAWRLTKEDGEFYDVALEQFGPTCSCAHATYRGKNSQAVCKHVASCRAVGLLPKSRST